MKPHLLTFLVAVVFSAVAGAQTPAVKPEPKAEPKAEAKKAPAKVRTIELAVTENGYEPDKLTVKKGEPVKFVVTRKTDATCAMDLLIEGTDIKAALPLNKPVEVAWTPTKTGKVKFGCAMGMMISGVLLVE